MTVSALKSSPCQAPRFHFSSESDPNSILSTHRWSALESNHASVMQHARLSGRPSDTQTFSLAANPAVLQLCKWQHELDFVVMHVLICPKLSHLDIMKLYCKVEVFHLQ